MSENCIIAQKIPEFRDIVSFVEFCVRNVPCAVQITVMATRIITCYCPIISTESTIYSFSRAAIDML